MADDKRTGPDDWPLLSRELIDDYRILSLYRDTRRHPRTGAAYPFVRFQSRDWVNVVPLTPEGEVVLIRQFRAGIQNEALEIPGGIVEDGEDPGVAALRELREETGFVGATAERLGAVHPNPALFDNFCHTYVARGVTQDAAQELDPGEEIAVERVPLRRVPALIAEGQITLADEIHTPDSSRYWVASTYPERHADGQEPESLDKEFLRLWLRERGISDDNVPQLDDDIRVEVAERYIDLFQRITGEPFEAELGDQPILERIRERIARHF